MTARTAIMAAWLDTRRAMRLARPALEARQAEGWRRLAPTLARTPALAAFAGRPLSEIPITEPGEVRRDFARWNSLGVTREAADAAAAGAEAGGAGEVRPGVVAGWSSGTTGGSRGVFLAGPDERARYIGQSLAKLLPASRLFTGARVALALRANSRLYSALGGAGRFQFRWFGLSDADDRAAALQRFDPDVLIAPSHVLADLARRAEGGGWRPRLDRLFWGAEPMGDAERLWIGQALGRSPSPILQATEGFLGAPCPRGRLHLNEDAFVIEREAVPGTGAFRLVVTDLFRRSQPVVRVRLDDLIEEDVCDCGRATTVIRPVAGRVGDLWRFGPALITPRAVTEALEGALGPRAVWRATASPQGVRVQVTEPFSPATAEAAVRNLLSKAGVDRPVWAETVERLLDAPKRRRVLWEAPDAA